MYCTLEYAFLLLLLFKFLISRNYFTKLTGNMFHFIFAELVCRLYVRLFFPEVSLMYHFQNKGILYSEHVV
jgi:hypothetical protein